ncbi:LysR family transcriptional regulator [Tistrella mobilis]|nr:LysR family transcriptional regulator [Tistrella mobilis]
MDRFETMRVFSRVVERRSFTRAAEDLGLPRSTVTDAVKALEARLGVRLLERTTRQVRPTPDGEAFHQRCLALIADLEDAEASVADAGLRGPLRADVHGTLWRHVVLPHLPAFLERHPGIELRVTEGDRLVDLVREGIDCVLRVGTPRDGRLIARRVALLDEVTVASPDYLSRHGRPRDLQALDGHMTIGFYSSATGGLLPLEFTRDGEVVEITLPARLTVDGAETLTEAARLGLGLIQVPRYHVASDIAAGRLVEVLENFPPTPTPVHLMHPEGRQPAPRVQAFTAWLAGLFRAEARR